MDYCAVRRIVVQNCNMPAELPLRVFISYKLKDHAATVVIKKKLKKLGAGKLEVFVSGDEVAGTLWREKVLEELAKAHILIFLYTDPKSQWDWCLYETGYFDARQKRQELDRHLYVLRRREDLPSGPFLGLGTVPIDASSGDNDSELQKFLKMLFEESTDPPVNAEWNADGSDDLVTAFTAPFGRREEVAPPQEFVRKLTFHLVKKGMEDALNKDDIPAEVSGNKESFELFGFGTAASRSWRELEDNWRSEMPPIPKGGLDSVKLWVANVAQKMLLAIRGKRFDDGLPLFFSPFIKPREQGLFRPSLARLATYSDAYDFDIVFVDVPREFVAISRGPLTAVLGLLKLATNFRFGWIEQKAKDVAQRELGNIPEDTLTRFGSVAAESFTLGLNTEQAVLLAFNEEDEKDPVQRKETLLLKGEVSDTMEAWKSTVFPAMQGAIEARDNAKLVKAFEAASEVNWKFHRACAQRYFQIVSQLSKEAVGPLRPV
jgi:hypothetical protein